MTKLSHAPMCGTPHYIFKDVTVCVKRNHKCPHSTRIWLPGLKSTQQFFATQIKYHELLERLRPQFCTPQHWVESGAERDRERIIRKYRAHMQLFLPSLHGKRPKQGI